MTIEVCERLMDHGHRYNEKGELVQTPKYHARVKGIPGYWGCGDSPSDAIGELIRNHPELFGVAIEFIGKEAQ